MRTFLALCLSVGTTRRIVEALEPAHARLAERGWKLAWVPPANLHVTVKFMGDIAPENIDAIAVAMKRRCADLAPISLKVGGLGAFPSSNEGAPRVLWAGVESPQLVALQKAVEGDLLELGFPKETRAFHSHLTLARVIEVPQGDGAKNEWPGASKLSTLDDRVGELVVYESKLHRAGAEHVARARVPFSKK
jgi:2'-5' RNA ligase